jgi:MFS transporter, DHA2 family, multidrug resistance protein
MSLGISVFEALITQNTQVEHSVLSVFASPLNRVLEASPQFAHMPAPMSKHGVSLLNSMITYQSQVIAYNNNFWLMAILSAPILLIVLFMRKPPHAGGGGRAVMD